MTVVVDVRFFFDLLKIGLLFDMCLVCIILMERKQLCERPLRKESESLWERHPRVGEWLGREKVLTGGALFVVVFVRICVMVFASGSWSSTVIVVLVVAAGVHCVLMAPINQ